MKRISSYTLNQGADIPALRVQGERTRENSRLKSIFQRHSFLIARIFFIAFLLFFFQRLVLAQNCPTSGTHTQTGSENTYFYANAGTLAAGSTSITLNAVSSGYGTTPIAAGDQVLIIQMQGAEIDSINTAYYGADAIGVGSGFIAAGLQVGYMEFAVATSAVPITGGVLNLAGGTVNTYINSVYAPGTWGQYTYQVIRVPNWFNIQLGATVTTPLWNGTTGGVTAISAVNQLNFNSQTINAQGAGFRGGGGRQLNGPTSNTAFVTLAAGGANGSKAEGIAGTPEYLNNNGTLLNNLVEGYPGGSYARGAPGNAGGGATDGDLSGNDENAGGGGGGNYGQGGQGGDGWSVATTTGGRGGASFFVYLSPARMILGGGGGAGDTNDGTGTPGSGFASSGASGGGMVIIAAASVSGTGTINASGANANNTVTKDGAGGGGGGGTVLIYASSGLSGVTVFANGGIGGSNDPAAVGATQHGPGGGGGGGVIYSNATLNAATTAALGANGISTGTNATGNFGSFSGTAGLLTQNITSTQLPPNMLTCQVTGTLSLNLIDFSAAYQPNNTALVSWTASNEENTSYYTVERSLDGLNFTPMGNESVNNSPGDIHNYSFNDYLQSVSTVLVYYRLKMVNADGDFTYSKIAAVSLDQNAAAFSVYPNPATDYAVLSLNSDKQSVAIMKLMDNSGREIMFRSFTVNTGNNSLMLDQLGSLPRGIYIIQVIVNNSMYNNKLVKQ